MSFESIRIDADLMHQQTHLLEIAVDQRSFIPLIGIIHTLILRIIF